MGETFHTGRGDLGECPASAEWWPPIIVLHPEMVRLGEHVRVGGFVKIEGGRGVTIGHHTHIASFCHVNIGGGELVIGAEVGMASHAMIMSGSNQMDAPSMSAAAEPERQHVERARTVIGDRAMLGAGSIVLMGRTIGEGAVIGAGAVVTHDVPAWEVWAGVPAVKIGERPHA